MPTGSTFKPPSVSSFFLVFLLPGRPRAGIHFAVPEVSSVTWFLLGAGLSRLRAFLREGIRAIIPCSLRLSRLFCVLMTTRQRRGVGASRRIYWLLLVTILAVPAQAASGETPRIQPGSSRFRFTTNAPESLEIWEGAKPVLVYNHGLITKAGVPADRSRSSYIHPLYGLDGEVLTDDFPVDHYHHRGLFWAWPHVGIDGQEYDLWMLQGIRQQFERWLARRTSARDAILGVENGWYVGNQKVMLERVWLKIHRATAKGRLLDFDFTWIPQQKPVTLAGAEGKSYGGLTLRIAPGTNTVITTPQGNQADDLYMTRLPWADLSRRLDSTGRASGAALFIASDHPDYPPMWLTRHYGVLCVGWPGISPRTFQPGESIRCRYRVWVHRGLTDKAALEKADAAFRAAPAWHAPAGVGD